MGDTFDGIALAMSPVIVWIDAPVVAGAVMRDMANAVHERIAHGHIRARHVDLCPKHTLAIAEFTGPHAAEQVQVLFGRTLSERAVRTWCGEVASVLRDCFGVLIIDIGKPLVNQVFSPQVQLLEIVAREECALVAVESEPLQVTLDGLDEVVAFFLGVRVIETQIARASEFTGNTKVQTDRLGMADVQKAVGFRWEARLHPSAIGSLVVIAADKVTNEVGRMLGLFGRY